EGKLPVRYFGVPLITSRLRANDCKALVDKITARVRSWTNKSLSYAGRVKLAQSVLFSIQIFWSAVSIFGAKVAWDTVCCPKNEGGLGLKLTHEWNKAAMVKHIWHILSKDSESFWCMGQPTVCSWACRKLLKFRQDVSLCFKSNIGSENNTIFVIWFPKHVPRHSFIAWLAILKRLHTQDRLLQLNQLHVIIWSFLLSKCGLQWQGGNWKQTIGWICSQTVENNFRNLILKFVFGAIIYQIWIKRNDRFYRNVYKDVLCVQKHIFDLVRCRIMGLKHIPFS
ncbi:hypothetical protein Pfo_029607, partial [Paulownia fortunei]